MHTTHPTPLAVTTCSTCELPVGLAPTTPPSPVHYVGSVALYLPHLPVPRVVCTHTDTDYGPHPGCAEFSEPVETACTAEATHYFVDDTSPFPGTELVCAEHVFEALRDGYAVAELTPEVRTAELLVLGQRAESEHDGGWES